MQSNQITLIRKAFALAMTLGLCFGAGAACSESFDKQISKTERKVNEFVPFERLGWFGYAPGTAPAFYHTWYLKPSVSGCLVITEEVGRGAGAAAFREADEGAMHRGHDLWLATLKWVSESK